jgi:hypothetical protein
MIMNACMSKNTYTCTHTHVVCIHLLYDYILYDKHIHIWRSWLHTYRDVEGVCVGWFVHWLVQARCRRTAICRHMGWRGSRMADHYELVVATDRHYSCWPTTKRPVPCMIHNWSAHSTSSSSSNPYTQSHGERDYYPSRQHVKQNPITQYSVVQPQIE